MYPQQPAMLQSQMIWQVAPGNELREVARHHPLYFQSQMDRSVCSVFFSARCNHCRYVPFISTVSRPSYSQWASSSQAPYVPADPDDAAALAAWAGAARPSWWRRSRWRRPRRSWRWMLGCRWRWRCRRRGRRWRDGGGGCHGEGADATTEPGHPQAGTYSIVFLST